MRAWLAWLIALGFCALVWAGVAILLTATRNGLWLICVVCALALIALGISGVLDRKRS